MAADGVKVRMYRQGLGDCFLVSFPREGGGRFHLMIDFGVILGTPGPEGPMRDIVRSIARETGGDGTEANPGHVDVWVATHEHWDHLSGFVQAKTEVETLLRVGEVWLAWTEDPSHPLAAELRRDRRKKVAHLHAAAQKLKKDPGMKAVGGRIEELLGFFGARGQGGSTKDALDNLSRLPGARTVYRRPGEPVFGLPGVRGARVFVLGPPEDRKLIKKSDPTKRGREVYELQASLSLADTFFAGLAGPGRDGVKGLDEDEALDPELADLANPFDGKYRMKRGEAERHEVDGPGGRVRFFEEYYGFGHDAKEPWRRIEGDWLSAASDLALALDSDTNNTSLALAIELGEGGPVLLFPADAQVGNWESWQALSWPADPARPGERAITADDLLRRTVLYKVGHHGSHNATLRENGLEKMTHPDLVALIPVDEAMATKKHWKMPFGSLYERLLAKTRGRVLRVDHGRIPFEQAKKYGLTEQEWNEFRDRTPENEAERWIEYHL